MKRVLAAVIDNNNTVGGFDAAQPKKRRRGEKSDAAGQPATRGVLGQVDHNANDFPDPSKKRQHPRKGQQNQASGQAQEQTSPDQATNPAKQAAATAAGVVRSRATNPANQTSVVPGPVTKETPKGKLRGYWHRPTRFLFPCDLNNTREAEALHKQCYTDALIRNLLNREQEMDLKPDYFKSVQTDIKPEFRLQLANWLVAIHACCKLREEVLWRTFQLIDRYLSKRNVSRKKLQLVACASLWIASKYFEIYPPTPSDLIHISDQAFTKPQLLSMEVDICTVLEMELSFPTPCEFMQRFMKIALSRLCPIRMRNSPVVRMDTEAQITKMKTRVKYLAYYIMERYALTVESLKLKASLLAAAALYTALALTSFRWTSSMSAATGYTSEDVRLKYGLYRQMKCLIMNFEESKHDAVIRKYAHEKRGSVSNLRRKKVSS